MSTVMTVGDLHESLKLGGSHAILDGVSAWLTRLPEDVDSQLGQEDVRGGIMKAIQQLNDRRRAGEDDAFLAQQLLLSRLYSLSLQVPTTTSAEGSVVLHEVAVLLERASVESEDALIDHHIYQDAPVHAHEYVHWLRRTIRSHRAYRHPYYHQFLRTEATKDDLRRYLLEESAVDARFDDLLALMQIGTSGAVKLEIAGNFWDEMGNGDPSLVHTTLFDRVLRCMDIDLTDLASGLTAEALLGGNLSVMCCRYRRLFGEAVGYLAATEWLVPDRFTQVLWAWERLRLDPAASAYQHLHVNIDSHHASGWFNKVVEPLVTANPSVRRQITRGVLWRLNSSARYLDHGMERWRNAIAFDRTVRSGGS